MNHEQWIETRLHAVQARIPRTYAGLTTELPEVRDWCSQLLTGSTGSLVLVGPKGTGKTGNAWCSWPHLISLGWVGRFHALSEVDYLDSCLGDGSSALRAKNADLLLLDDLGGATVSDWSRSRLLALFDTRWLAQRPTIVTTNLTTAQLAGHLGDRAASRLADQATFVSLTGPDRRLA